MTLTATKGRFVPGHAGLTKIELSATLAIVTVFLIFAFAFRDVGERARAKVHQVRCVDNLKHVGLAFRIFASANGDQFPAQLMESNGVEITSIRALNVWESLKRELSTPKILWCPADKTKAGADTFTSFSVRDISYFASLTARSTTTLRTFLAGDRYLATNGVAIGQGLFSLTTNAALSWTPASHPHRNILMADGSVHQLNNNGRLTQAVRDQEVATNWLVFP